MLIHKIFNKENIKYLIIFAVILLFASYLGGVLDLDVVWNYGFSYAISRGEVPYRDFNMVVTPLYSFIMAIPFLLFGHNLIVYLIANSLVFTLLIYLLFKLYHDKTWYIVFLSLIFIYFLSRVFGYNLGILFCYFLLIYCEKENKSDYLIGFILGCALLTKQSVGLCLLLPNLFYLKKDIKKILKRIIGFLIPISILLIYLILTNSLYPFIDLCFLGMFDFAKDNGQIITLGFVISVVLLILNIIYICKNKKDITGYYCLAFFSIIVPLFDFFHVAIFLFALSTLLVNYVPLINKKILYISLISALLFTLFFACLDAFEWNINYPSGIHNFEYFPMNKYYEEQYKKISQFTHDKEKVVVLGNSAYIYKIAHEEDIDYFDLLNRGNYGYHGLEKLKKKYQILPNDTYFIIEKNPLVSKAKRNQFYKEFVYYVMDNSSFVKENTEYLIYQK